MWLNSSCLKFRYQSQSTFFLNVLAVNPNLEVTDFSVSGRSSAKYFNDVDIRVDLTFTFQNAETCKYRRYLKKKEVYFRLRGPL